MKLFLKTNRLLLRYITQDDFEEIKSMLQDNEVMYAWEHCFTNEDVQAWIDRNLKRYRQYNLGYFILEHKLTGEIIGQAALVPDIIHGQTYYEIGYILKKRYWHKGYASEAAKFLINYAFNSLNLNEIIFEIRPSNLPSIKVAQRLNAKIFGQFIKNVNGTKMQHLIYKLHK